MAVLEGIGIGIATNVINQILADTSVPLTTVTELQFKQLETLAAEGKIPARFAPLRHRYNIVPDPTPIFAPTNGIVPREIPANIITSGGGFGGSSSTFAPLAFRRTTPFQSSEGGNPAWHFLGRSAPRLPRGLAGWVGCSGGLSGGLLSSAAPYCRV